jgi:SAM-dependent methyltransferase
VEIDQSIWDGISSIGGRLMNRILLTRIEDLWMREGLRGIARHLFRRPSPRQKFITRHVLKTGHGLEIEPGNGGLAPKAKGFHVETLGYAETDTPHEKNRIGGVDINGIEHADYAWHGEPLSVAVGHMTWYDWIIASHVIEKTPDFAGFLIECEALLRPNGKLVLAIPDKRHCFDHIQSLTSTGDVLDALSLRRTRIAPGRIFDHHANAVRKGRNTISWHRYAMGRLHPIYDLEVARHAWQKALNGKNYIDVHNWYFTPQSFRLLIEDLRTLGLIGLSIVDGPISSGGEFYVCLHRSDATANPSARSPRLML